MSDFRKLLGPAGAGADEADFDLVPGLLAFGGHRECIECPGKGLFSGLGIADDDDGCFHGRWMACSCSRDWLPVNERILP